MDDSRRFEAGQAFFQTGAFEIQFLMMQPELVKNRGVEVVNADWILDNGVTEVVGFAVAGSAFDSTAGHP